MRSHVNLQCNKCGQWCSIIKINAQMIRCKCGGYYVKPKKTVHEIEGYDKSDVPPRREKEMK